MVAQTIVWQGTFWPQITDTQAGTAKADMSFPKLDAVVMHGLIVVAAYTDGHYVADDEETLSYGVGQSPQEAFADWETALRGRFEVLLANEDSLAPNLALELQTLRATFQGAPDESGSA